MTENSIQKKGIAELILNRIQHFDYAYYFKIRERVVNPKFRNYLLKLYYLYRIKKMDAYNNASLGTNLNSGASFLSPPRLPHGLNGIIIGHDVTIGQNVTIHQQVTVEHGAKITIGNHVQIGAGAKILRGAKIGDHVKIGANCVVFSKIPKGATVVLQKPRVIIKSQEDISEQI